jgi:hypothetical protein
MVERDGRQEKRVILSSPLNVIISSIGSDLRYEFKTRDLSVGGMFLKFADPNRLPFTSSSLLEVWVELGSEIIFCNAKIVRIVHPKDEISKLYGAGVAIRVVEIQQRDSDLLSKYLSDYISEQEAKAS